MNVLILGSGGREHALGWKIAQSSLLEALYIAPGNAGTAEIGTNVNLDVMEFEKIRKFCKEKEIRIVVVGPEAPLVAGIKDFFKEKGETEITIIGPGKIGAQLEGSKEFAKKFMERHNIPTAKYASFTKSTIAKGYAFLESIKAPYVIKCDGLAAGKGVLIIEDLDEAKKELKNILVDECFGEAGNKVVIEEFLKGIEVSMFVITDGHAYKILPEAKDYKRIGEGDTGPNTGGMGAISPVPFVNQEFMEKVKNQIIIPTVKGLGIDGIEYDGFVFFGLIKVHGDPYVIEYNVRMGDPECEVVIPRLKCDLLDFFEGIASGTLSECDLQIDDRSTATVMMTSGGYPDKYAKGKVITGFEQVKDSVVFHSGTKVTDKGIVTNGGRVLAVTSYGSNYEEALKKSYENVERLQFKGMNYRPDIGFDLKKVVQKA